MTKKLIYFIPGVIIVCGLLVWGGIWIGSRKSPTTELNDTPTSSNSSQQGSLSNSGGLSVENSSSGATNLGQLGAGSAAQGDTGTSAQGTSNAQSGTGSSSTSPTDPSTFAQYAKDINSSTALFGDVQVGSGAALAVGQTAVITYKGYLTNGTLFDESKTESNGQLQPLTFVLGQHQVIPGMEEGVAGMKVGGTRLIIIPPALGYGSAGQGPVPGNAVLVFVVELLDAQ
jgi:FKBP-type peptidyl-prolyl cis-trans isomerase